jgi:ABC-type multidrug transport system fused ATPase/permease subunit
LAVAIDLAIIALLHLVRWYTRRRRSASGANLFDGSSSIAQLPPHLSSNDLTGQLVDRIRTICGFIDGAVSARPSVDIAFEGLVVSLGGKTILQGVAGRAASCKITAIMGGSGSGKSTLLHCLRGRNSPDSGCITINGASATLRDIQHMVGFCAQDDDVFLLPTLTVEETLHFAALTRMPRSCSAADRQAYIDTLILKLGLHKVRHSLVGACGGSR